MQVTCEYKSSLLIFCEKQQEQTLANNTKFLKLYLASLLPTVQDDNIQESMETFLSTVQEPFYPLQRNIQEFHNIRGASKNSIMTGSPLPSSSVITAHKHATRREAMTKDSCRPMILKSCQRPVHGATKRKRRTGRNRQEFWRLLKH